MHKRVEGSSEPLTETQAPRGREPNAQGTRVGNERELNCFDITDNLRCQ